jgi:NADH dehydrogenase FAD-containing subunit
VGAPFNTYGAPGVEKHAFRVKEVEDALAVRGRLIDMLETASLPGPEEEERRKMCAVVVVGGGPIGVSVGLHSLPGCRVSDGLHRPYCLSAVECVLTAK